MSSKITRTSKGYRIDLDGGGVANIGAAFTHVVLYPTGGWNPATNESDLPTFSKHKTLVAARREVERSIAYNGVGEIVELANI